MRSLSASGTTFLTRGGVFTGEASRVPKIPASTIPHGGRLTFPTTGASKSFRARHSPFDREAISQVSGGFTTGGTGWYRKTFILPETLKGKRITILFEGVYMNATVWLNGRELGNHPYGYTSFGFDLTPGIRFGEKNTLAVKVVNEGENSRWYSGSGIYRHVWLGVTGPVHVTRWGTFVSTPEVTATSALTAVRTTLVNSGDASAPVKLVTRILDPSGREVASAETTLSLRRTTPQTLYQELRIPSPLLWSVDKPRLYTAVTEVHLKDGGLSGTGPAALTTSLTARKPGSGSVPSPLTWPKDFC